MTDEQQERLNQIRKRRNNYSSESLRYEYPDGWKDVDFLLNLVDSQVAEGVTVSTLIGYEAGLKEGEDSMRSACIEKVKEHFSGLTSKQVELDDLIKVLGSATIQEQKS